LPVHFGRHNTTYGYSSIKSVNEYEDYNKKDEVKFPSLTIRTATLASAPYWTNSVIPLEKK
jgi:hypothetical protein